MYNVQCTLYIVHSKSECWLGSKCVPVQVYMFLCFPIVCSNPGPSEHKVNARWTCWQGGKCSPLCCPHIVIPIPFESMCSELSPTWSWSRTCVIGRKGHVPTCDKRCYGISADNSTTDTTSTIVLGVNGRTLCSVHLSIVDWLYWSWIDPVA